MSFVFNKVPALSEEFLEMMGEAREQTIGLKEAAYGEDCNRYDNSVGFYPRNMTRQELERSIHEIFPDENLKKISEEQKKLRHKIDYELVKIVATEILPQLTLPGTLFEYDFYVVARDMSQIDSKTDPHRGRKDRQAQIISLPVEDWKDGAWEEYIILDPMANSEAIYQYMPNHTNRLLSTVHRFYAVNKKNKNHREKNTCNGFLPGYRIHDSKLQVDFRTKSGAELSYKFVSWLTGIERKPNQPRKDIRDLAGARIIFKDYYEEKSIDFFKWFMDRFKGNCEGSLILQTLHSNEYEQTCNFLKNIPIKSRSFCEKILEIEDRTNILSHNDVKKLENKYYLEMLIPFSATYCRRNDVFGRNIINLITQPLETYKKIREKQDDFLYKGRAEYNRERNWPFFEWYLLRTLAKSILTGDSLSYIKDVTDLQLSRKLKN